jgi:hypothetical protein
MFVTIVKEDLSRLGSVSPNNLSHDNVCFITYNQAIEYPIDEWEQTHIYIPRIRGYTPRRYLELARV